MVYKKQYFINLTYHGKTYNSLNRFALDNHADFRQVYNNYHRGVRDPEHLLMPSPWLYDIHALGLLTISEVAEKTNLPNTLLYSTLHNILKNPGSTRLGLTENDIVALDELKLSYVPKNPKYVFKQSVLNHIEAYGSKLAHSKLLVIPQLMPIYLYDLQKHELWSSTHGAQGIYRKRHIDKRGYYQVSLVSNDKISYRIKAEEIEDLIAYPTIYAKDLVTRKVILDSIPDCFNKPYSGKTFYINLVKKMFEQKKHKRFDTSLLKSGHSCSATVYGVTKADARAIIRTATRKAQKQAEESKKKRDIKFKALLSKQKRQREHQKQSREAAKWVKAQKKNNAVKKNKAVKKNNPNRYHVTYQGKTYASLRKLAEAYHVSYDLVLSRKEHGVTDYAEMLKQPKIGNIGRKFVYDGHNFNNLHEMSNYLHVDYHTVQRLNHMYELNSVEDFIEALEERNHQKVNTPLSFPRKKRNQKRNEVVLAGKKYSSIRQAAIKHNLTPSTLYGRIRKYGKDYPYLFDEPIDTTTI